MGFVFLGNEKGTPQKPGVAAKHDAATTIFDPGFLLHLAVWM